MREITQNAGFPARLRDGWHLCIGSNIHEVSKYILKLLTTFRLLIWRCWSRDVFVHGNAPSMNKDTNGPRSTTSSCFLGSSRERKHHMNKASRWEAETLWRVSKYDPKWVKIYSLLECCWIWKIIKVVAVGYYWSHPLNFESTPRDIGMVPAITQQVSDVHLSVLV